MNSTICLVAGGVLLTSGLLRAQEGPSKSLGAPTASLASPFSRVGGVREQSDGRVIVLDAIEARLARVDLETGTSTPIGRSGRGPGEYTLPIALVALGGDTTLAVDMSGGGRALVITLAGASTVALRSAGLPAGAPLFSRPDVQADRRGRLYELVTLPSSDGTRYGPAGVSGVRRLDRASGVQDTLGHLSLLVRSSLVRPQRALSSGAERPERTRASGPPPPFASVDQWAVDADGRIALVTVEPYRVAFVSGNGNRMEGPVHSYSPVAVSGALQARWREARQQPVATLVSGPDGLAAGRMRPRFVEPAAWPDLMPPFLPDALRFAPDGTLWIERAVEAGHPQTFDLVDRAGRRSARVVLPAQTRLVGFGPAAIYIVRIDEDDVEYLQRHALPR